MSNDTYNDLRTISDTEVRMTKMVNHDHVYSGTNMLSGGVILKWMDTIACLSAELLAQGPCVTASVDDMQLKAFPVLGNIVVLVGRVNRAFNTSMEVGVTVEIDNLQDKLHVCKVFFTFVEKRGCKEKRKLPQVAPTTEPEKMEYNLAAERRKYRLNYNQKMQFAEEGTFYNFSGRNKSMKEVEPKEYRYSSTEIVLPPHANHHKTTFGGQIMEWIEQLAYIVALKVCENNPTFLGVDEIHFKNSSVVSDRISLRATVNHTWSSTVEIGVQVQAYQPGHSPRHCNSAFLTYGCNASLVPRLLPVSEEDQRRSKKALLRRAIRYERSAIRSQCRMYGKAWQFESALQLCRGNTQALVSLYKLKNEWEYLTTVKASSENEIIVTTLELDKTLCFRAETTVPYSAQHIFSIVKDVRNRHKWDPNCQQIKILEEVGENSTIFSYNLKQRYDINKALRLLLLCTPELPSEDLNAFTVAYTSLLPHNVEEEAKSITAEIRCSGFVIRPVHSRFARKMTARRSRRQSNSSSYSDSSLDRGSLKRILNQGGSLSEPDSTADAVFSGTSETEDDGNATLRRSRNDSCILTYVIHTAETIVPYIARDIAGFGDVGIQTVKALHDYLLFYNAA